MAGVILIGNGETKTPQLDYLSGALRRRGLSVDLVDVSLGAGGTVLPGGEKLARMKARAAAAAEEIAARSEDCAVAIGIGGGTGSEIVLAALAGLPATYPKVLITTMAFDPRPALADTAITLIPTLCDIEGMNTLLAQAFENAAAIAEGLAGARPVPKASRTRVAVTTLGATGPAGAAIARSLDRAGREVTVFHANGYGGAAFVRFVAEGGAEAVIDLNVHELGRMRLAGDHVPMPERFSIARDLPRVVLPGSLNFLGLGALSTVSAEHRGRPHYQHSGHFTHVKLTEAEMADQAAALADALNLSRAPCRVLLPMGGFSHEDRGGGAIEDEGLRGIAAESLERTARAYTVTRLPHHINASETADAAVATLEEFIRPRTHHNA